MNEYGQGRVNESDSVFFPGADDNASGVALVLSLAAELILRKEAHNVNYIIAFFSAEELGLHGSEAFLRSLKAMDVDVVAMLNFDMVGRLDSSQKLVVQGVGTGHSLDSLLRLANNSESFELEHQSSGVGGSDYTTFYFDSIPALNFTTGIHADYHTPRDTEEKINYAGILAIQSFVSEFLKHLALSEVYFQKTKMEKNRGRSSLKVTLGIMPGYGVDDGLKVEAVSTGKVGDLSGLQEGYIIVGIDDCTIASIHDDMDCLKKYDIGDMAELRIMRKLTPITLSVEFK